MTKNKAFKLHALALALCSLGYAHAQVQPSAGQVLRELQTPAPALPNAVPAPRIESAPIANDNSSKVFVKTILITGNQEIPTSELTPLVSSLVGSEQTLSQLNAAARRITAFYRSRGFAVARALL
ncbi:MAG: POTRA domain-containing protein, partial [Polaromonas sp.]